MKFKSMDMKDESIAHQPAMRMQNCAENGSIDCHLMAVSPAAIDCRENFRNEMTEMRRCIVVSRAVLWAKEWRSWTELRRICEFLTECQSTLNSLRILIEKMKWDYFSACNVLAAIVSVLVRFWEVNTFFPRLKMNSIKYSASRFSTHTWRMSYWNIR